MYWLLLKCYALLTLLRSACFTVVAAHVLALTMLYLLYDMKLTATT
jgi:hypothetical protein